ncbi:hypothetical protein KKB83_05940, partial [Patescibacteria group bacterium]|nr:hypothetical protein [Patescibacteria group bacterium]
MNQELQETINYIREKAGNDYHRLNEYLTSNRLFIFLVTKKMVGKSIYAQYLQDVFPDKFVNISLGQVVRNLQSEIEINEQQVIKKWNKEIVESLKSCSVKQLPP